MNAVDSKKPLVAGGAGSERLGPHHAEEFRGGATDRSPPNPGSNLLRFGVLSVTFTVNVTSGAGLNPSALAPSFTACVTVTVSLVLSASLTALPITVSAAGATAPASSLVTSTTTAPDGCPVSVTVCVALPPSVSANAPVPRLTSIAASLSRIVSMAVEITGAASPML